MEAKDKQGTALQGAQVVAPTKIKKSKPEIAGSPFQLIGAAIGPIS